MKWNALIALPGAVFLAQGAHASGFALIEQNASGMGNAYAGQAAVAAPCGTGWTTGTETIDCEAAGPSAARNTRKAPARDLRTMLDIRLSLLIRR